MKDRFDVVVVGSGAGGGVVAGELAQRGRDVLLLECGPHLTAADFTRWEAKATHELFWPIRFAPLPDGDVLAFLAGRCVGGTTTINTKVALRADERDMAKWYPATGLTNARGEPFTAEDLTPFYDRVERVLGVRERSDWLKSVHTVEEGFRARGATLEPVRSYTNASSARLYSQSPAWEMTRPLNRTRRSRWRSEMRNGRAGFSMRSPGGGRDACRGTSVVPRPRGTGSSWL